MRSSILLRPTLLVLLLAGGCATIPPAPPAPAPDPAAPPVLLVNGIFGTNAHFSTLARRLEAAGHARVRTFSFVPNDGRASMAAMARQLDRAVERLRRETRRDRVDVVAFSMGALVTRYWLQRHDGHTRTRRFVSISGPHQGTLTALLLANPGVLEMRPGSDLLRDLERDTDPWRGVEVFTLWTPLDLIIVPAHSSQLPQVRAELSFPVLLHPWMLTDSRVLDAVVRFLASGAELPPRWKRSPRSAAFRPRVARPCSEKSAVAGGAC